MLLVNHSMSSSVQNYINIILKGICIFKRIIYFIVPDGPLKSQKFGSYMLDFKNLHVYYSNYKILSSVIRVGVRHFNNAQY